MYIYYTEESSSDSCYNKVNLDCNYTFLINLESNGIPFGVELRKRRFLNV